MTMADLEALRFPVGRFSPPASSTAEIRAAHIQTLRELPERLRDGGERLERFPA